MVADEQQTARVYSDTRGFPIYISYLDEHTRLWFWPWRVWDGATCLIGLSVTALSVWHWLASGVALYIAFWGLVTTVGLTWLARQIPISRPHPLYRLGWLLNCLIRTQRRPDPWMSPPQAVDGNLIFTKGGVYAEFVLAGQPGGMLAYDRKKAVAEGHRPLVRLLPSGMILWGVCAPASQKRLNRRMLTGYETASAWVDEVQVWQDFLAGNPFYEPIFGIRVPVDSGMAGRGSVGKWAKTWQAVLGVDHEDQGTVEGYRRMAAEVMSKIPAHFDPKPATPRQIQWLYRRRWTLGAADTPFPGQGGPGRLEASDFADPPAEVDEGDQKSRKADPSWLRRHLPSMKALLRIKTRSGVQSYQALLAVAEMPRDGLAYPRAEYLLAVYDADVDASVDWFQHITTRPREKALNRLDWAQRNLDDQADQSGNRRSGRTDLARRVESAEDYQAELASSSLESEAEWTTVVAVGSKDPRTTLRATQILRTHMGEELQTQLSSRRGAQRSLWQIGGPGSEEQAPLTQFSHPTTTEQWARFAPLTSTELGNETGILLAENLATLRPTPVFVDLEGSTARRDAPGMLFIGPPGGGKSECCKRIVDGLIKRGSQASIIDPGTMREWVLALAHHGDRVAVIDPTKGRWSLDPLRIFPRDVAVEHALDHLCPMWGIKDDSVLADDLRYLLRPDQRVAESLGALLRYLNANRDKHAELAAKLNSWAQVDYLRAMFDESLPVPPIAEKDAVIWLTSALELPDVAETDQLHLYERQSRRARAGFAIYGLIAALTRVAYTGPSRRGGFGWLVCEEARTYFASPVGRKDALRIVTQGRKEHYGLLAISQHAEEFDGIGAQDLPMRIVTPFKPTEREYAKQTFKRLGIDPAEYPEVLNLRTAPGHGYAYFIDHLGRAGLVDLLPPAQQQLVEAFDTRYLGGFATRNGAVVA